VIEINAYMFPVSLNTQDSYVKGLRLLSKKQKTNIMCQKSKSLNFDNEEDKEPGRTVYKKVYYITSAMT